MTSARAPLRPPIIAPSPMRTCWRTAAWPPNTAKSPTITWPPQHRIVGEDDIVADMAIMGDMRAGHEEAAFTHLGHAAIVLGPDAHGDPLADVASGPDKEPRRPAAIPGGLRRR